MSVEVAAAFKNGALPVKVIGIDVNVAAVGRHYVDAFYQVPRGRDPAYIERVLEICKKENINVVVPGADDESLNLARNVDLFEKEGIRCVVPKKELIEPMLGKGPMFDWLSQRGVAVPRYHRVQTLEDLRAAAASLGYPGKPFVLKPSSATGGRGVWIISSGRDNGNKLSMERSGLDAVSLEHFIDLVGSDKQTPSLLAMEYLEGDVFDVDVLADQGKPIYMVSRRRFHPKTTPFRGCVLERNEKVLNLAADIQRALGLTYLFDFDIILSKDGEPNLLEVNPRFSGSVIATIAAGLNLLEFDLRLALGLEIPRIPVPYGKAIFPSYRTTCV